jgi:hypothetical protein
MSLIDELWRFFSLFIPKSLSSYLLNIHAEEEVAADHFVLCPIKET